jgi:hypothetical protein
MKSLRTFPIVLVFGILLFSGMKCKKETLDQDGLPKFSQIGAMVFACKLNGVNWISSKKTGDIVGGVNEDLISFRGTKYDNNYEIFEIQINKPGSNTSFKLNDQSNQFALYITDKICQNSSGNNTNRSKSSDGEVLFTKIDKINKIISGTFRFDVPTEKCGNLKITEGRFDIQYY